METSDKNLKVLMIYASFKYSEKQLSLEDFVYECENTSVFHHILVLLDERNGEMRSLNYIKYLLYYPSTFDT